MSCQCLKVLGGNYSGESIFSSYDEINLNDYILGMSIIAPSCSVSWHILGSKRWHWFPFGVKLYITMTTGFQNGERGRKSLSCRCCYEKERLWEPEENKNRQNVTMVINLHFLHSVSVSFHAVFSELLPWQKTWLSSAAVDFPVSFWTTLIFDLASLIIFGYFSKQSCLHSTSWKLVMSNPSYSRDTHILSRSPYIALFL